MGYSVLSKAPAAGWKAYLDQAVVHPGEEVVASAIGSDGNFYAAVKGRSGKVRAVIGLIEGHAYKLMSEEMGPYYYGAPAAVLDALSVPAPGQFAVKWRAQCRYELDA